MYFLDCPYSDKDEVKSLGAKWNSSERKWYVPPALHDQIPIFNRWTPNGRIFLNVPYAEKDAAKANGARWDATVKFWYCTKMTPKLEQWISFGKLEEAPSTPVVPSSASKPKKKASSKRGNAETAARLQISDAMTVSQLQDECRHRGISGLSGKNKTWLLDQLGVGTTWLSHPSSAVPVAKKSTPGTKAKKTSASSAPAKSKTESKPKAAKGKAASTKKISTPKKRPADDGPPATSSINWSLAPRITSKMTISQLSHELLKRDPSAKGLSSKPKSWFLSKLGENSVWTTSPSINAADLINVPVVTKSLTNAQLMHEIMARNHGTKGLSSKSKDDLISMVGIGSIWTTGSTMTNISKQKAPPAKKVKKEKATPRQQTSAKSTQNEKVVAPETVTSSKAGKKSSSSSSVPPSTVALLPKQPARARPVPVKSSASSVHVKSISNDSKASSDSKAAPKTKAKAVKREASASIPKTPAENPKNQMAPVFVTSSTTSSAKQGAATKKALPTRKVPNDQSIVNASMTVAQLMEEIKYRYPEIKGLSGKNKSWLIAELGEGTPVLGVKADADAKALHIHQVSFLSYPLADSTLLRATRFCGPYDKRKRVDTAICDLEHPLICTKKPYRSSEPHDYDICRGCFDIESLPKHERDKKFAEIDKRIQEIRRQRQMQWEKKRREEEARWQREEEKRERARKKDLLRFTAHIKKPSNAHTDENRKKKFTVWTKETHPKCGFETPEFDSSFDSVKEANLRVEFLFYYNNHWDEDKEEVYTKEDELVDNKFRYLVTETDYGETYTVSAMPSAAFESLDSSQNCHGGRSECSYDSDLENQLQRDNFPAHISNPPKQNLSEKTRLRYTVWTSCGYDNDGWHSYHGPPDKEFNSSFDNLEDANKRAEFVFYFDNPWGLGLDEMGLAESDDTSSAGFRFLECCPDDSERWTVSVVQSSAFPFMNSF